MNKIKIVTRSYQGIGKRGEWETYTGAGAVQILNKLFKLLMDPDAEDGGYRAVAFLRGRVIGTHLAEYRLQEGQEEAREPVKTQYKDMTLENGG